ncbi:glucokinase [Collimonas humicola]|uniref:glucokinase n=1 Tax=Collimonas humicola TaxID=2825886 RepID=UPI001B8AB5F5|nr:glucokinase [Collimonas humicola]
MTIQQQSIASTHSDPDFKIFRDGPRLLADIGGTHARFALETAPGRIEAISVLSCKDYPTILDAIRVYLSGLQGRVGRVQHAAFAIANPIQGDQVRMTNHDWAFSIEAVRSELRFDTLLMINDFKALAMALPYLTPREKLQMGGGVVRPDYAIGLIGAGTGLGVSGIFPSGDRWVAMEGEGGHVTFAPSDEIEIDILRFAWRENEHVSAERLLSGSGLELIYRALADSAGQPAQALFSPEILRRGLAGECAICDQTIACFCAMLGTIAGNVAVTLGALGGLYIGGGIVPRLGERFIRSNFRQRFERKGRFSGYLSQIPTYVITAEYPAFMGVAAILEEKLRAIDCS